MFTFLNFIGKKFDEWVGATPLERGLGALFAMGLILLSLAYGYMRFVQREEAWQSLEDRKPSVEVQKP